MKVEIVSSKVIKPSVPTPNSLREYKLSFFDQLSLQTYVGYTFLYPKNHKFDNVERCDQLEKSLSETLSFFYMVAGTCNDKDHTLINCDDQGVVVTRALVHAPLNVDVEGGMPDTAILDLLLPCRDGLMRANPHPVLAIQLNLFSCGGIGLGYRMMHSICDGLSRKMFFDHWSATNRRLCLGLINDSPPPVLPSFELVSRFLARQVLVGLKPYNPTVTIANVVTKCIVYKSSFIAALKQEAAAAAAAASPPPSKVVAVTAHIWRTFTRISEKKNGYARPCKLFFAMNLRGIIVPHPPPQSWGTLVSHPTATWSGRGGGDLSEFVDLLSDVITKDRNEFSQLRNPEQIYSKLVNEFNELKTQEEDVLPVASMCRFGWYDAADFGWDKPSWISPGSMKRQRATLMDIRDGDSVEVWLALDEQDMVEFQRLFLEDQSKLAELLSTA